MPPLRVLLTSQPGGGKTTVCTRVQDALRAGEAVAVDGFLSREVRSARGLKVGYELHSLDDELWETLASSEGPPSGVTVAKYFVYVDALERVALPVLDRVLQGAGPRVCVVDDVGGMTCKSDAFVDRVFALLSSSDPDLHALVALGAGGGTTSELRRVSGVASVTVDEESRGALPESLTARFRSVLCGNADPSQAPGEADAEDEDDDLSDFDSWGGDSRQLGVKRGSYSLSAGPPASPRAEAPAAARSYAAEAEEDASRGVRGRGRGIARMAGSSGAAVQASQAESDHAQEERHSAAIPHCRGRGRGLRPGAGSPAPEEAPVLGLRGRGRARGRGAIEAPYEPPTAGVDVLDGPERSVRGRGRGRPAASEEEAVPGRGRGRGRGAVARPRRHEAGVVAWLEKIDDGKGVLMQTYGEAIKGRFDLLSEVFEVYLQSGGDVSGAFFEDFGVTKVGHRRLFEKSFREVADAATGA